MSEEQKNYYIKIGIKILVVGAILIGLWLGYKTLMFYIPFVIAYIIASCIEPLIKLFMRKTKIKRKVSATISLIIVVLIIGTLLTILISTLITEITRLLGNLNVYFRDLYSWGMNILNDVKNGNIILPQEIIDTLQDSLGNVLELAQNILGNFFKSVIDTLTGIPDMITSIIITVLATVFICFDRTYVKEKINKHFPKIWIEKANLIKKESFSIAFNYIKAEAKLSFICFILALIGLIVLNIFGLNIEYPITMAILIGFIDLLPLFGAGAVMVPWSIYMFIVGNIPAGIAILALWILWAIIKQLSEPKMISKEMGMNPIFTLIGMYTGYKLWGVLGLMIGPILLLIIKNVFKSMINRGILKSFFELE